MPTPARWPEPPRPPQDPSVRHDAHKELPHLFPTPLVTIPSPPRGSRASPSTVGGRRRASAWTTTTRRRTNVSIRTAVVFSVDLSRQFELTGPRADASSNFLPPTTVDFELEIRHRPSFSASPGFSFTL